MRICSICRKELPEWSFSPSERRCKPYNNARVKAGYAKSPANHRKYDLQRYRDNRESQIARRVEWAKRNPEEVNRRKRESYAGDKGPAIRARNKLRHHVKIGEITKPISCSSCGGLGRRIEAHHEDYDRPLDVLWLCSDCHGKTTRKPLPRIEMVL